MKNKSKKSVLLHIPAVLFSIAIVVTLLLTKEVIGSIKENITESNKDNGMLYEASEGVIAMLSGPEYLVREHEGRIGVFNPGETQPFRLDETYVAYLPEADKEALRQGISVYGITSLEKLLDDLHS